MHDRDDMFNKVGNINSAWTLNLRIWEQVVMSNQVAYDGISRRYVHDSNFESAHPAYTLDTTKGKPLSAYEYAKTLTIDDDVQCIKIIKDIMENQAIVHDMDYVESLVESTAENE